MNPRRPAVTFLDKELRSRIIAEARGILCEVGMEIQHEQALELLAAGGARIDRVKRHVLFTENLIDSALASAPASFRLYDVLGRQTNDFSQHKVHFTPGSSALKILDGATRQMRRPATADYVNYAKIVSQLENLASQSTAFIPADVPEQISDSYRLFLSLLYCEKPVITGTFSSAGFSTMKQLLLAVRGSEAALRKKPLAVFTCCPTTPLKWSDLGAQNVLDCAGSGIPIEVVPMPLAGFTAPVTLMGTLVQHTAEALSGVVLSQLAWPGAPVLYGGSTTIFDMRHGTTPMGAVETMILACATNEIGTALGLPTQAYVALSDAKLLDTQAGIETGMGAALAALSGINNISGPGMLDFENCQSLEKLIADNEICGMALRLARGVREEKAFPGVSLFQELVQETNLLISDHTQQNLRHEHLFPGPVINRTGHAQWQEQGSRSLAEQARMQTERLIETYEPSRLPAENKKALTAIMQHAARAAGMSSLP